MCYIYMYTYYIYYDKSTLYLYYCFMYISSTPCINFEVSLRPGFTFFFMAWNVSYGLAVIWHGMVAASYTQKIKKGFLFCFTPMPHTINLVESKILSL